MLIVYSDSMFSICSISHHVVSTKRPLSIIQDSSVLCRHRTIEIPTAIRISATTFLNELHGFAARFSLVTAALHPYATIDKTITSPSI